MTDASWVAGRGAGKTWALCAWQRQDPEHRVIIVPSWPMRECTARMLDPETSPQRQRGVVSVRQVADGCLRGRPKDTELAIDEWEICNQNGREWLDHTHPFQIVAWTDTGLAGKTQAKFLEELGVPT